MTLPPNHHADYPAPSGLAGFISGATMVFGRAALARVAAEIGGLEPGDHVVDIGSGPGAGARVAAKLGATVTGIEPADVMRTWATRTTRGNPPIRWVDAVAQSMPLDDDSVDIAWSISTVHHWPELTGGIAEVGRILRPGGKFVVVEKTSPPDAPRSGQPRMDPRSRGDVRGTVHRCRLRTGPGRRDPARAPALRHGVRDQTVTGRSWQPP